MSGQRKQEAADAFTSGASLLGEGEGAELGMRAVYSLLSPSLFTMELLPRAW